jgi:hypothetical protein
MPIDVRVVSGDIVEVGTGRVIPGNNEDAFVEPTWNARRVSLRPLDYALLGQVLGHYRAVSFTGTTVSIGAAGILSSLWWRDAARFFVLLRLSAQAEVTSAITTATPVDLQAFVMRGITGAATGGATLTMTGDAQKTRKNMSTSLLASSPQGAGEIRTASTAALTAATGKANDGAPFGVAVLPMLLATNGAGTAVALSAGTGCPMIVDLYNCNMYHHPIILSQNEGIEIQEITAGPVTGGIKFAFIWEWAEVAAF